MYQTYSQPYKLLTNNNEFLHLKVSESFNSVPTNDSIYNQISKHTLGLPISVKYVLILVMSIFL